MVLAAQVTRGTQAAFIDHIFACTRGLRDTI
jgi:hypothetical protein